MPNEAIARRLRTVFSLLVLAVLLAAVAGGPPAAAAPPVEKPPPPGLTAGDWGQILAQLPMLATKLEADDAQSLDGFGWSVAVSGEVVVVGASAEDGGAGDPLSNPGAAYVFARNQGGTNNWGQVKKLTASDAQTFDQFGISVAISGDVIVVGANLENGGPGDPLHSAGAAYVFGRNQGGTNNWGQVKQLTASDAQANDEFGVSVAISGDVIVVGAYQEDGGESDPFSNAGAAYAFQRDQGGANNWGQVKKLTAGDPQGGDRFGVSVAMSGDVIVVGANLENGGPGDPHTDAGAAYVFARDQGGANNWGQVKKLTAGDAQAQDRFGYSVAISGDIIVVGAPFEDGGPANPVSGAGGAYVFGRNQGGANNWGQVKQFTTSDAQANDLFGQSVAISDDVIVVGAYAEDGGPGDPLTSAGAAYAFQRDQGGANNWGEISSLRAGDAEAGDVLGHSVAVGGNGLLLAGATLADAEGPPAADGSGAAYAFCQDDDYEDNEFTNDATPLSHSLSGLQLCSDDPDVFVVQGLAGREIEVGIYFSHADGDLDLYLYDSGSLLVANSISTTDSEFISYLAGATDIYYVQVVGYESAMNRYDLALTELVFVPLMRR